MLPSFAKDTVTLTDPVWVEERGKQIPTFPADAPSRESVGWLIQPSSSTSDYAVRDNVEIRVNAFAPPHTIIDRHTRVTFEGTDYAVYGEPKRWKSPTGRVSHVEVLLIDWEG